MAVKFELPFTQTSHVVAFVCTLLVAVLLSPVGHIQLRDAEFVTALVRLVHLATFASWLGVQVWVTFFAGLTMFHHLPRHMFGFIQSKLFPKYFLLGTILSSIAILSYLVEHPFSSWGRQENIQGISLGISLLMVLCNLLYFEPQTTKVTFEKHVLEKEQSAGETIGKIEEDKLKILKQNPKYVSLSKKFVRFHTFGIVANLISLSSQAIHLWFLAGHLNTI